MARKQDAVDKMRAALAKKLGAEAALRLGGEMAAASEVKEVLPTSLDVVNRYVLGVGGWAAGRMSEVLGEESCGKTSFAQECVASAQKVGARAVIIEGEYAFDVARAASRGVRLEDTLLLQPKCMEDTFDAINIALEAHDATVPLFILWDSLAATPPRKALEWDAGDGQPAEMARICSQELQKLPQVLAAKRAHLCIVNQTRAKLGVMFGNNTTTPGGNALKFYCTNRLQLFRGKSLKDPKTEEHLGQVVTFLAIKSKTCAPFRKAKCLLRYASGWDNEWSTIEHAKRRGLISGRDEKEGLYAKARALLEENGWASTGAEEVEMDEDDND